MDSLKQGAMNKYDSYIAKLETIKNTISLLPDGLEGFKATIYYNCENYIRIDIPMTLTAFADFRRFLGSDWKRKPDAYEYQSDSGDRYFSFLHRETGVDLRLCLKADSEFATCERKQVGVKEVPIMEAVCN